MKKGLLHTLLLRAVACCFVSLPLNIVNSANADGRIERLILNISVCVSLPSELNTITLPFKLVGRLIFIQARVDTLTGDFLVDTGSERLILNQKYIKSRSGRKAQTVGSTGDVESALVKQVDSLHLGALTITNLQAHIVDITHIEQNRKMKIIGILGYDVFKDFNLFFDFQNSCIVLTRLDKNGRPINQSKAKELPYDSLVFTLNKYLIIVSGEVNHVPLRFILDSGAELNQIERRTNRKVLANFVYEKSITMIGVGKDKVDATLGALKNVECGHQCCSSMKTLLTSMEDVNAANNTEVDGVLGYEFFIRRRVMINYKKKMLYFFGPQMDVYTKSN